MSTREQYDHGTLDILEALAQLPEPTPPAPKRAGHDVEAICALMAGDPIHATDRRRVVDAILTDGLEHDGVVDPNRVRARLTRTNADGSTDLTVYPCLIGAIYLGLTKTGVLQFAEWTTSTDTRGRNAGRPARTYHLNQAPEVTP